MKNSLKKIKKEKKERKNEIKIKILNLKEKRERQKRKLKVNQKKKVVANEICVSEAEKIKISIEREEERKIRNEVMTTYLRIIKSETIKKKSIIDILNNPALHFVVHEHAHLIARLFCLGK
jgi:hypothetical protein